MDVLCLLYTMRIRNIRSGKVYEVIRKGVMGKSNYWMVTHNKKRELLDWSKVSSKYFILSN